MKLSSAREAPSIKEVMENLETFKGPKSYPTAKLQPCREINFNDDSINDRHRIS
jgi:hypothetical protein